MATACDALRHTDSLVDDTLGRYEEERVVDVQLFLEDFVRREMAWHARALELLTPLVGEVRGVDAKGAMEDFFKKVEEVEETEKDAMLAEAEKKKRESMAEGEGG